MCMVSYNNQMLVVESGIRADLVHNANDLQSFSYERKSGEDSRKYVGIR